MTNPTDPNQTDPRPGPSSSGQSTGGPGCGGHGGHPLDSLYDALRRPGIARASRGRWFAGVAAGLARRLGVDPLVVRAGFILFSLFFGMGVTLYLVLWLLMPDERGAISLERALKHGEGHSIFLLIVTVIAVVGGWGNDGHGLRLGGLIVLAALVWWYLTRTPSGRAFRSSRPWAPPPPPASSATGPSPEPDAGTADPATTSYPPPGAMSTGNAAANAGATAQPYDGTPPWGGPVAVPRPPRERVRGIGFPVGLLVLGLAMVAAVVFTEVGKAAAWPGNHLAAGIAAGLGVLGLGILIAGLAGRRVGWLAPFAVLAMASSLSLTAVPAALNAPWQAGDQVHRVTTLTSPADFQLGAGQLLVDLSSADYKATPGVDHVRATLGLGDLTLVVPEGANVQVNAAARAGDVRAIDSNQANGQFDRGGTAIRETLTYGAAGPPDLVVDAEVGLGQITIRTGAAQ